MRFLVRSLLGNGLAERVALSVVLVVDHPARLGHGHGQGERGVPLGGDGAFLRGSGGFGAAAFQAASVVGVTGDMPLGIGRGLNLAVGVVGIGGIAGRAVGGGFAFDPGNLFDALDDIEVVDRLLIQLVVYGCGIGAIREGDFIGTTGMFAGNGSALSIVGPGGVTDASFVGDAVQVARITGVFVVEASGLGCRAAPGLGELDQPVFAVVVV
ncbi:hypothetical protein [Azomonas macrocytogenes]|uniref:Uncharacterized protein n=1 Tax=Azomonas macrocytogenes TaxID=69962 RepID=A0A839T6S3_AZOMA|nr:hypothetical protein [Azomonas macrocytogenes]MBB3105207.1 hypothetical protein [Azomonas macrocytogenes]